MSEQARVWHIYWVAKCRHCRPAPSDKFVVIVCRDESPMGFLINSAINKWIQKEPKRAASQAKLAAAEHRILDHDSWVDCIDLYPFTDAELTSERGRVSKRGVAEIRRAVSNSETIVSRYKAMILKIPKR